MDVSRLDIYLRTGGRKACLFLNPFFLQLPDNRIANHKYSDSASFGTSSSAVTTGSGFDNMYNSAQLPAASNNGYDSSAGSNAYADSSDNSNAGFSGASSSNGFNNGNNGGINLIEGHTQTLDLTGGSNGGQRVVYKPVIKQGEPIITKNFYVVSKTSVDVINESQLFKFFFFVILSSMLHQKTKKTFALRRRFKLLDHKRHTKLFSLKLQHSAPNKVSIIQFIHR